MSRLKQPSGHATEARRAAVWRWPIFGGWLPLIAFYNPACRRDGSPWSGHEDPGYRITILAVGWLGHGMSVTLGRPRPRPVE